MSFGFGSSSVGDGAEVGGRPDGEAGPVVDCAKGGAGAGLAPVSLLDQEPFRAPGRFTADTHVGFVAGRYRSGV